MDQESLMLLLEQGLSVEQIAKRFDRDPSTVSYWMRKFGLQAPNRETYAAKGALARDELAALVDEGLAIAAIAERVGRSATTVRHWLTKYGLRTTATERRRAARAARVDGRALVRLVCRRHGETEFWIEGRGNYRCLRCRREAVTRRRRRVKELLVVEAGGGCSICGYNRCIGALQFHHRDPGQKSFSLSELGLARSLESARAEAAKCVLLCSNCHAEVENGFAELPIE